MKKLITAKEDGEDPLIDELLSGEENALSSANSRITKLRKFEIVVKDKLKKGRGIIDANKKG